MKRQFGEYVRIARGLFGCSSLWRGQSHYLYVRGNGFLFPLTEQYFRFEFQKIQSAAATRTHTARWWCLAAGVGAGLSRSLAAAAFASIDLSPSDPVFRFFGACLAAAAAGCLLVIFANLLLGPTCVFQIQTAVQRERIRPLRRWKRATAVLQEMIAEIELAQQAMPHPAPPPPPPLAAAPPPPPPSSPPPSSLP